MTKLNVTIEQFTRVKSDINGNSRHVIHFLDLLTESENESIKGIDNKYKYALNKVRCLGGKMYMGKEYGGGIVFQSNPLQHLCELINNL